MRLFQSTANMHIYPYVHPYIFRIHVYVTKHGVTKLSGHRAVRCILKTVNVDNFALYIISRYSRSSNVRENICTVKIPL